MAFAWRTGAVNDHDAAALAPTAARGLRIGVSTVLAVALIYLFFIVKTFRKYGDGMDKSWREKVIGWAHEGLYAQIGSHPTWQPKPWASRSFRNAHRPVRRSRSSSLSHSPPIPITTEQAASLGRPF